MFSALIESALIERNKPEVWPSMD